MKTTITTSKQLLFAFCLAVAALLTGRSNGNDEPRKGTSPQEKTKDGSTEVTADNLTFDISEKPFGADEEATRSSEQPARPDTIELADGVTAAVTV